MNIVADANIFVSAYIWYGNPKTVLDRVVGKIDVLFFTDSIINEIEEIIKRSPWVSGARRKKIIFFLHFL